MEHLAAQIIAFIKANPGWSMAVIGITAFGESFAFLSLLFPGTAILVAAGGLISTGALPFFSTAAAGIVGAVLGDSISFWLGEKFGPMLPSVWPFRTRPGLLARGIDFFGRYGGASVFIGRFFGPLRAVVPVAAGMMHMPAGRFYIANVLSAILWAPALVVSGALLARSLASSKNIEATIFYIALIAGCVVVLAYWARRRFHVR